VYFDTFHAKLCHRRSTHCRGPDTGARSQPVALVGLTVNLMIYWRLWARQTANAHIAGGAWVAFLLVLASAILSWMLLTVFAVACSQQPAIRRKLSREMIAYRQHADSAGQGAAQWSL
jgi:cobalamin biosynthesis protein CobD/CbiB